MDSDEESTKEYAELTPVMLETLDGEQTEVKVPFTSSKDLQNTVESAAAAPLPDDTSSNNRVSFASCNIDSAGYTGTENYSQDNMGVRAAIKVETDDYCGANDGGEICDDDDSEEFAVYRGLQLLFRGLPKEMFVSRILSDTASCETKLGEMRSVLFEQLKEAEDFPYGLQAMLKRRVYTRSGDSVPIKLAHDIHTLMSVTEGAEYSEMRELLSSGSGRSQRSQSCSSTANETIISHDFSSEIKVLAESVNTMKADMLKMKQSHLAVESTRSKQIDTLKSTVFSLKADISKLSNAVTRAVTDIRLSAERIESEKSLGVTNLKSEMRLMKGSLASIEDTVFNMQTLVASGKTSVSQSGKTNRKAKSCHPSDNLARSDTGGSPATSAADSGSSLQSNLNLDTPMGETLVNNPDCSFTAELMGGQRSELQQAEGSDEQSSGLPYEPSGEPDIAHDDEAPRTGVAEGGTDQARNENARSLHNFRSEMNMNLTSDTPNVPFNAPGISSYKDMVTSTGSTSHRNDTSQSLGATITRNGTGQSITTRVTRNIGSDNHGSGSSWEGNEAFGADDDDDFQLFVKKKAKRYYLGGFKPSITRQRIENYVNRRGPTVTWVRIWNSKRRPNNVIIRLNVEDNDRAKFLENETFWPRGVTCRPWTNGRPNKSRNGEDSSSHSDQLSRHIYGRSDIDDYNPFSPLRDFRNVD